MLITIPKIAPGSRVEFFDELRGIAIIMIVLHHSMGVLGLRNLLHLESGVDIFLAISGLVLALGNSSLTSSTTEFIRKRILRIFPAYWIALALFLVLGSPFDSAAGPVNILFHFFGIQAFGPRSYFGAIASPFWFISLILLCYLAYLFIRRRIEDNSFVIFVAGMMTLAMTLIYFFTNHEGGIHTFVPRIPVFFAGLILGRAMLRGKLELKANFYSIAGLLALSFTLFFGISYLTILLAGLYVILWFYIKKVGPVRSKKHVLLWLGALSYEIFLFHGPFVQSFNLLLARIYTSPYEPTRPIILISVVLGITFSIFLSLAAKRIVQILYIPEKQKSAEV